MVVKPSPGTQERENRNMGWFSYAVPEFTWDHFYLGRYFNRPRGDFKEYDLIYIEDGGNWGSFTGGGPPVVYMAFDSTLSEEHYRIRYEQAKRADLVLLDHDRLSRFPKARRLSFCVNDHVYKPFPKDTDVAYHCMSGKHSGSPGGVERSELRGYLGDFCKSAGYSYRSGAMGLMEYAASMGSARIVVNWPRTLLNRPHRVFDAMACGACLVTGKLPPLPEEHRQVGVNYVEFEKKEELPVILKRLLDTGEWKPIAEAGYKLVMSEHTWQIRARELRQMLEKELGL